MLGHISIEGSHTFNYHTGFSNNKSDILIHLSQWQYWWWFWFAFSWAFYFFVINRVVRTKALKLRPKMNTSNRSRGKWGDFLAAILPVTWCLNIITNSNFILRLMEWQYESSLFTVRIRARQWYWIYKFELRNFTDVLTAPKNIGHNKWSVATFGDLQTADDYLHALQLRAQSKWVKKYWNDILKKSNKVKKMHIVSPQEQLKMNISNKYELSSLFDELNSKISVNKNIMKENVVSFEKYYLNNQNSLNHYSTILHKKNAWSLKNINKLSPAFTFKESTNFSSIFMFDDLYTNKKKNESLKTTNVWQFLIQNVKNNQTSKVNFFSHSDLNDNSRWLRRSLGNNSPVRIIKLPINLVNDVYNTAAAETDSVDLFRIRFNNNDTTIKHKSIPYSTFLTIKQKRYKRKKAIPLTIKYYKDEFGNKTKKVKTASKPFLLNNSIFIEDFGDPTKQYRLLKKNKVRTEVVPVTLAKRLLRVKRTLILPAHMNITFITNSYDVIHSWFIPGLGVKIDCVPGRSTHHTFYIDCVGFYYGLCAEICGRYHHHMPIRVCALPFEHFLVWWQSFGLPKFLYTNNQKRFETYYAFRKYVW